MLLTTLAFAQMALSCAPGDSPRTLASVAKAESGLETWALHDNTTSASYEPSSLDEAKRLVVDLIDGQHHSVDVGLMQVNSLNFARLGLSPTEALDPCRSIKAGAAVLREGYLRALRVSFSVYNTGNPVDGFANGYVARVEAQSRSIPDLDSPSGAASPLRLPRTAVSNPPVVVVDMLHGDQAAEQATGVVNLLPTVSMVRRSHPRADRPSQQEISAADPGTATD